MKLIVMPVIWWLTLLSAMPAFAQPKITFDSACGAAGVGYVHGDAELRPTAKTTAQAKGMWVNAGGYWTECPPAPPPPPPPAGPAGCGHGGTAGTPPFAVWTVGGHTCTSELPDASSPDHPARVATLAHGQTQTLRQWLGDKEGTLVQQCVNGERVTLSATCAPATGCATMWSAVRGPGDGKPYVYDGRREGARVPMGGYALARDVDGGTWRLQCVAGRWKERPQCQAPQTVARSYATVTRHYRYDGPPVDVGAKVRAEQTSPGANRIRWTVATCTAGGILQ